MQRDGEPVDDLGRIWEDFGRTSCAGYSPLYEEICAGVARDQDVLDLTRAAPLEAHMPNVLLAAVHFLVLDGVDHDLAGVYDGTSGAAPYETFRSFVLSHRDALLDVMATHRVQTNEIGRSAIIAAGLAEVERRAATQLAVVDVGASAGLNLLVDAYGIDYELDDGIRHVAPAPGAPTLSCRIFGPPPVTLGAPLHIDWRLGLDRSPIDLTDASQRKWLEACVWPDQPARLARLREALVLAAADPPAVLQGDAVEDLAAAASRAPAGAALTIVTTWAVAFLTPGRRGDFVKGLGELGRPVWWVAADAEGVVRGVELAARPNHSAVAPCVLSLHEIGPDASRARQLGWTHPHGEWLAWVDAATRPRAGDH